MSGVALLIVLFAAAGAGWMFWKAATATRPRRAKLVEPALSYAAASDRVAPHEAELLCQALEEQGVHATFYGRENTRASLHPRFADWRGAVQVLVRNEDVARARAILSAASEPTSVVTQSTSTAAAAFGEPRRRRFRFRA